MRSGQSTFPIEAAFQDRLSGKCSIGNWESREFRIEKNLAACVAAVKRDLQLRVRLVARRLFTPLAQAKFAAHFLRISPVQQEMLETDDKLLDTRPLCGEHARIGYLTYLLHF